MKALIIYCTEYKKHTEKIARIFAKELDAKLVSIKDIGNVNINEYDLIGFGSGVYRESLSQKIYKFVEKVSLTSKKVFVFSTSGVGMKYYNKRLIKLLESKGGIVIGSFACKGSFVASDFTKVKIFNFFGKLSQGHPNEKDYMKAKRFIREMVL